MKHIIIAGLFCATISPVFAATSDVPPRIAAARAMARPVNQLSPVSRNEIYAMLAAGITLLAYVVRNKAIAEPNKN